MRSGNPFLRSNAFNVPRWDELATSPTSPTPTSRSAAGAVAAQPGTMTVSGAINASFILITLCIGAAVGGWTLISSGAVAPALVLIPGLLIGLVTGLIATFAPRSSPFVGPVYALAEGAFLAGLSWIVGQRLGALGPSTVAAAAGLTFAVFFIMLIGYRTGVLRFGATAVRILMIALATVLVASLGSFLAYLFGFSGPALALYGSGPVGIGFSVICVALASAFLVIDFQFIEEAGSSGTQPKYMEWYAAVALLGTLVWLYAEILRLLSKLRSNN